MDNQNHEEQSRRVFNPNNHLIQLKSKDGPKDYLPVQYRLVWFREKHPQGSIETELVHLDLDKEMEEEAFQWNADKRRNEKVIKIAKGVAIFRATVKDGQGGVATATKMEKAASFPDFLEKAETGAIGRALAALGYGTQFTGDELSENHRIVDAPVTPTVNLQKLKVDWSAAYHIPIEEIEERWPAYLQHLNIGEVTHRNIGKITHAIEQHKKQRNGAATAAHAKDAIHASNGSQASAPAPTTMPESEVVTGEQINSIRKLCERLGKSAPGNVTTLSYLAARKVIRELTAEYRELKQQNNKAS